MIKCHLPLVAVRSHDQHGQTVLTLVKSVERTREKVARLKRRFIMTVVAMGLNTLTRVVHECCYRKRNPKSLA